MFTALFSSIGIIGFIDFLKSAIFLVGYISNNQLFPEPLSPEEEKKCLELMAQGDEEAKNILIERNLRLVAHICKKYTTTNVEQDDLISIGTIGLIKGSGCGQTESPARDHIVVVEPAVVPPALRQLLYGLSQGPGLP